jgi:hypothetical protein
MCLFCKRAIFLVLWYIGRQLGLREEHFFERKNLRHLGFDITSHGKEFLLELSIWGLCVLASEHFWEKRGDGKIAYLVRCHIKVDLGGTHWARLTPRFSPTVRLVRIRFMSCLMRALRSLIALLSPSCYKVLSMVIGRWHREFTSRVGRRRFFSGAFVEFIECCII